MVPSAAVDDDVDETTASESAVMVSGTLASAGLRVASMAVALTVITVAEPVLGSWVSLNVSTRVSDA